MLNLLNPAVLQATGDLHSQFQNAKPFRHVVIENFLDPDFLNELMADFPRFEADKARNERGDVAGKAVVGAVARISPAYSRFDNLMKDPGFLRWIGQVTGIQDLLYDPHYIGGGTHENRNGQELDVHVDFNYHPKTHTHRRLNLILFLNREWHAEWGGLLELLQDPWTTEGDGYRTVLPIANRAVIFETTESSWHGFRMIQVPDPERISRRSLAVYFYTKDRAERETAPFHATIYYQRPMPPYVKAGHTLTEEQARELEILFARRDQHMRFLYEREQEWSSELSNMRESIGKVTYKIVRAILNPQLVVKKLGL